MDQSHEWERHEFLRTEIGELRKRLDVLNEEIKQAEHNRDQLSMRFQMALAEYASLENQGLSQVQERSAHRRFRD